MNKKPKSSSASSEKRLFPQGKYSSPSFQKSLKKKLLSFFSPVSFFEKGVFPQVQESFAHGLRENLISSFSQKKQKKNRPYTSLFSRFVRPISAHKVRSFVSASFAVFLFVGTLFFGASIPSQAGGGGYIDTFVGNVFMSTSPSSEEVILVSGAAVQQGNVLRTGAHSGATVSFFEDSILRLDENTIVSLEELSPHSLVHDLGSIRLRLEQGRVWIKVFSPLGKYSSFSLSAGDITTFPNDTGALDVSLFSSHEVVVRAWERSARVHRQENEIFLPEGRTWNYHQNTPSDSYISLISPEEKSTTWVLVNQSSDDQEKSVFLQKKQEFQNKKTASRLQNIKQSFSSSFEGGEEDQENIRFLLEMFFGVLTKISQDTSGHHEEDILSFSQEVQRLGKLSPHQVDVFLASAKKNLHTLLPDSPLFVMKTTIDDLESFFAQEEERRVLEEKNRTQRLWEASILAQKNKTALANTILLETTEDLEEERGQNIEEKENQSTEEEFQKNEKQISSEIIEERQDQIVVLGKIQGIYEEEEGETENGNTKEINQEIVKEAEKVLIKNTSRLVRPGFPTGKTKTISDQAYHVVRNIERYKSFQGQKNTLQKEIHDIESIPENIPLLLEIKRRLPNEFRDDINQKILSIFGKERQDTKK